MSHKTMVNGTVYEIDGGKTLIGGVAYSIDKGKTLVGGTAYEVGFAEMVQVTLKTSYGPKAIASINGEQINLNVVSVDSTYDVPVGAVIGFINTSKARGDVQIRHIDGTTTTYNITANGGSFSYTVIGKTGILVYATNRDYGPNMYEPNTPVFIITEE